MKALGIVLLVLGCLALVGSIANGSIADFTLPGIVSKLLTIGFIVGGLSLMGKKKQ
ncbi:MAG: hypothetical protein IKB73_03045 [Ruminococcus sp.]|nr:hypothetical protein [Ruminococcus sp.]